MTSSPAAHLTHDDLVLAYYGEPPERPDAATHLAGCAECRTALDALGRDLSAVEGETVPEPAAGFEEAMWRRLAPRIAAGRRRRPTALSGFWIGAVAASLVAAFLLGRHLPRPGGPAPPPASAAQVRERVLLLAVAEHLERSQVVLVELVNAEADETKHLVAERESAADLVASNRLYRQAAVREGETGLASVLDDLERVLLEVAHGPEDASAAELARIRRRIEQGDVLFKVRVIGRQVRERQRNEMGEPGI